MTAALLFFRLCTRAALHLLWPGQKLKTLRKPFAPSSSVLRRSLRTSCEPRRLNVGTHTLLQVAVRVSVCVFAMDAAVWGLRGRDRGQSIYIPEQSLRFCRSLAFPQDQISFKWWCWVWRHSWGFLPICFSSRKRSKWQIWFWDGRYVTHKHLQYKNTLLHTHMLEAQ